MAKKIVINAGRPHIEIDGVYFYPGPRVVSCIEILYRARGETVSYEQFGARLRASKPCVHLAIFHARKIFDGQRNCKILNTFAIGYRMERSPDIEFLVLAPQPELERTAS